MRALLLFLVRLGLFFFFDVEDDSLFEDGDTSESMLNSNNGIPQPEISQPNMLEQDLLAGPLPTGPSFTDFDNSASIDHFQKKLDQSWADSFGLGGS